MEPQKVATKSNTESIVGVAECVDWMANSSECVSPHFEKVATALGKVVSVLGNCFLK